MQLSILYLHQNSVSNLCPDNEQYLAKAVCVQYMIHVEEDSASSGNHLNFPRWSQPETLLWDFSYRPKGSKAISDRLIEQTII